LLRGRGNGYKREASPLFDSPLAPLSLKGEGGDNYKREAASLSNSPSASPSFKGEGGGGGDFREGLSPFLTYTSLPLVNNEGREARGRFLNNLPTSLDK